MVQWFLFSKWCNGKIIIWCNGDMVKLSNGESFFGTHFHRWRNGEMANKINSTMSCMVRFNCCVDYQIGFILLDFCPSYQLWPSWRVWGISTVLYMGVCWSTSYYVLSPSTVFSDGEVVGVMGDMIPDGCSDWWLRLFNFHGGLWFNLRLCSS